MTVSIQDVGFKSEAIGKQHTSRSVLIRAYRRIFRIVGGKVISRQFYNLLCSEAGPTITSEQGAAGRCNW
jgi:hypothetical protein